MSEIAQMTFNGSNDFYEIMDMLDKRLNDKGKNWRHVLKSLKVLDYCLHEGSELVVTWASRFECPLVIMPDPVPAVIVVASMAAVTLNMAKMTRLLFKSQDPKVWTIGIRLAVEQARTEEWARRIGVNSNEDLERLKTQLPSESARVIVVTIWNGLSMWTKKATKKFDSYVWDVADPKSLTVLNTKNPRTPKGWAIRYKWVATGYPDLLELVDTLTALNDGWEKIVPPPPGYQVHAVSAPKIASADNDVGCNFGAELINSATYRRSRQSFPLLPNSIPRPNATPFAPSLPASALAQRPLSEVQNPPASQ
ncbi:Epsin-like, N-terminal [Lasallia pustulata]|uniref:Epsin-like, N-terminal n=1 Tax=Lasallia pustulata TaxID=136370 RepID=A0A1W5D8S2_9LECA|nr:Epsin-like, N-terminal [Lasallia pustulata]